MQSKASKYVRTLCECAIMIALAFALSFVGPEAPMGGRITPASMLPIFLIAIRHGVGASLATGTVYAALQIFQSLLAGNTFVYVQDDFLLLVSCVLFDYVIPFILPFAISALFARFWSKKPLMLTLGITAGMALRFASHYVSGFLIWGQWADGMSPYLYSLLYNGGYMLPEAIITAAIAFFLMQSKEVKKLLRIA